MEECKITLLVPEEKTFKVNRISFRGSKYMGDINDCSLLATWYYNNKDSVIELSSWVLYDILEAKRVIRHEVAHVIKSFCKFDGGVHGRGYYKVLRIVSGKVWKRDRRWKNSVSIEKARSKIHPKIRIEFE